MPLFAPRNQDSARSALRESTGFWLYALHLITVWGLALSNVFQGLTLLWSGVHWPRLRLTRQEFERAQGPRLMKPFLFYVAVFIASAITSYNTRQSLWELRALIGLTTLPMAILLVRGEDRVRQTYDLLIWVSFALAWYGILQYALTDYGSLERRIPGPFGHYMTYSGVLLLGVCVTLGRLMGGAGSRRWKLWLVLLSILVALGMTLTRNVWLAAFVVLTLAFVVRFRRWLWVYAAVVVLGLVLTANLAPRHWSRITSIISLQDVSNYDRICMAEAGLHMIADRPLFGIGPGMVYEYYPIYRHPTSHRGDVKHLHNTLLQLAAERGLMSVAAYLWLMLAVFLMAYRAYRSEDGSGGTRADLYLGLMLAIVALNIGGVFEANWRDTEIQRWMLFLLAVPVCVELRPLSEPAGIPDG